MSRATMADGRARDVLRALADEVNREHAAAVESTRRSVEHAIRAGRRLLEVKALLPYGSWLLWVEENFVGGVRTAQGYKRLAERAEDAQRLAHLGIAGALRALATPRASICEEEFPVVPNELPTNRSCPRCAYTWQEA